MTDARVLVGPSFDSRKQTLDPGAVHLNGIAGIARRRVRDDGNGDQVFGAGEDEDVGFPGIGILR